MISNRNRRDCTINHRSKTSALIVPTRDALLSTNFNSGSRTISQILGNYGRISGTYVSKVGSFLGSLKLCCEYRDCDCNQYGLVVNKF